MPELEAPSLVLFDIDGTLIRRAGPHHRHALEHAVEAVTGARISTDGIPTHGMLDTGIVEMMYARSGLPLALARRQMPTIIKAAEDYYLAARPASLARKTCPGARMLLRRLAARGVPLMLVTGNFPRIGMRKMELAGLAGYFLGGAFAGMSATRAGLAKKALVEAKRNGWLNGKGRVWLIGDSPSDVLAAREAGVLAVAVSTGISSHEELDALAPDVLVRSLAELPLPAPRVR